MLTNNLKKTGEYADIKFANRKFTVCVYVCVCVCLERRGIAKVIQFRTLDTMLHYVRLCARLEVNCREASREYLATMFRPRVVLAI
jgi:hypothetical protein